MPAYSYAAIRSLLDEDQTFGATDHIVSRLEPYNAFSDAPYSEDTSVQQLWRT
jgi:hypothetical protein